MSECTLMCIYGSTQKKNGKECAIQNILMCLCACVHGVGVEKGRKSLRGVFAKKLTRKYKSSSEM